MSDTASQRTLDVGRALLWLLPGLLVFLVAAALLAPAALLGRTLALASLAVVPGILVLLFVADVRRRRERDADVPDGVSSSSTPPTEEP